MGGFSFLQLVVDLRRFLDVLGESLHVVNVRGASLGHFGAELLAQIGQYVVLLRHGCLAMRSL